MKKTRLILVLVLALSLVSIAAGVGTRVGTRFDLMYGSAEMDFEANAPFHIAHGYSWGIPMNWPNGYIGAPGRNQFTLYVDGVKQHASFMENYVDQKLEYVGMEWRLFTHMWVFNFSDGMEEGTHIFTGVWETTCDLAKDYDSDFVCVGKPNSLVEQFRHTIEVTFTP